MSDESNSLQLEYWSKLKNSILNFQYIEESLRMYLVSAQGAGSGKSNQDGPAWSYKDLQKDCLEGLLDKFHRLNDNRELFMKLASLKAHRDALVQRACRPEADLAGDMSRLSQEIREIDSILKISAECLNGLFAEWRRLRQAGSPDSGPPPAIPVPPGKSKTPPAFALANAKF